MVQNWKIKTASIADFERWMTFVAIVQHEFHNIDLISDEKYRKAISKNINRSTAIYIEKDTTNEIIGAMIYSLNSNHIGWLAVRPDYRRKGIGTALVKYMFKRLPEGVKVKVKTFLKTDPPGKAAQKFYESLGFRPKEILEDIENENAGKPFHLFVKDC